MCMAKIVHSEAAPAESVHYNLAGVEFDLSGTKSYETLDPAVISNALAHPWLDVKYDKVDVVQGAYVDQIRPEDDPLSAVNSVANDPEAARAAEAEKAAAFGQPVALDAGLDQKKVVETGPVAETLAADETSKTSTKKDN